jgi:hypothetical protein
MAIEHIYPLVHEFRKPKDPAAVAKAANLKNLAK